MALESNLVRLTMVAGEDLSTTGYQRFVTLQSDGQIDLSNAATENLFGVLDSKPAAGISCPVKVAGVSKITSGAALVIGARVTSDATGRAITASGATDTVRGVVMSAAAGADEIVTIRLTDPATFS